MADPWADPEDARRSFGVELTDYAEITDADCVILAVCHAEYKTLTVADIDRLFDPALKNEEKVLVDVKSILNISDLRASGMRFWRL